MTSELVLLLAVLLTILPLNIPFPTHKIKRYLKRRKRQKYQLYLLSPEWRKLRNRTLERDGYKCQNKRCGSSENLEVHHLTYKRLYKERLSDLITLCRSCHKKEHGRKR